jgi:alkylation response protein AidB-like acyl-CoA dehydrogenase
MIPELDLSSEGRMLKETARDLTEKVIIPRAQEYWESGEFPYDILDRLREIGYLGIMAPEEYGGSAVDTVTYAAVLEELARGDMTAALTLQVHVLVTEIYEQFGTQEQKDEWLPRLASGEILASIAMTEPGAGSDLRSISTKAELRDGTWIINGSKTFITNAGTKVSDGCIVLARTGPGEFSTFIVPDDTPGFIRGQKLNKLGWRAMDTRELFFEDCAVPEANLIGPRGKGLRVVLTGMDLGRIAFGVCSTGLAQACLDHSLAYANERVQFQQPLSSFQAIQFKLADMATKVETARAISFQAARRRDAGMPSELAASMAKLYASRVCVEAADEAFQIYGGYGFVMEYPIARLYADAKMMEIGEGTNEVQRMYIARALGCADNSAPANGARAAVTAAPGTTTA